MQRAYRPAAAPPDLVPELLVRQLSASLDFYCRLCGFHILYRRSEEHFVYLQRDGAELMLNQQTDHAASAAAPAPPHSVHFQINVRDIDTLYKNFGTQPFLPMQEKWYATGDNETGVKQFVVCDPDGYLLRFSQRIGIRPREHAPPAAL